MTRPLRALSATALLALVLVGLWWLLVWPPLQETRPPAPAIVSREFASGESSLRGRLIDAATKAPVPGGRVVLRDLFGEVSIEGRASEDGMFFQHKGFIVSEFRTALVKNLKAGYFKYGASSITFS